MSEHQTQNVGESSRTRDVVLAMKSGMKDESIWEKFKDWGEQAENQMYRQADVDLQIPKENSPYSCDICMVAMPHIFQRKTDESWVVGYRFIIDHIYFDGEEKEVKRYQDYCFLVLAEGSSFAGVGLGKDTFIGEFILKEDIEKFQSMIKTH